MSSASLRLLALGLAAVAASACDRPVKALHATKYLYVWSGPNGSDSTGHADDQFSVVDADPQSSRYGKILSSIGTGVRGQMAHHMELSLSPSKTLFADDFMTGQFFVIDLANPVSPRIVSRVDSIPGYRKPHSFARLQNGHVILSMQYGNGTIAGDPGGLAELDERGRLIRVTSAADSTFPGARIRPNGIELLPAIDRILTTSMPMDDEQTADVIQVWRLSDLKLLHTVAMPRGDSTSTLPYDARILSDGRTAMLNTYYCGLFTVSEIGSDSPHVERVGTITAPHSSGCAVAAVVGHYWIVPDAYGRSVVSFDVSNPSHPVEKSSLQTDSTFFPHWISADRTSDRLVINTTDDGDGRVLIAHLDQSNGALTWDEKFRDAGSSTRGVNFSLRGPGSHRTMAHSAVFGL